MNQNEMNKQLLLTSGLFEAYQYVIKKLCENGLPTEGYFEICANSILEYDLIRQGVISENPIEENFKPLINLNNNTSKKEKKKESKEQTFENNIKSKLILKNQSLKSIKQ